MGGIIINNSQIRCHKCLNLHLMKIRNGFPMNKIIKKCSCSSSEISIMSFLYEYQKKITCPISCSKCKKTNLKEPLYCYKCQRLYCVNCNKEIHNNNENQDHHLIVFEKYGFF